MAEQHVGNDQFPVYNQTTPIQAQLQGLNGPRSNFETLRLLLEPRVSQRPLNIRVDAGVVVAD